MDDGRAPRDREGQHASALTAESKRRNVESSMPEAPGEALRTIHTREAIATRVAELGQAIAADYADRPPILVSVLKGSFVFAADLARALTLPVRIEFLGVQSYGSGTVSTGAVQITQDLTHPIEGQDILIVEDIVDTGLTLAYILSLLRARGARSLKVCAFLDKPSRRRVEVPVDYVGFTIPDVFVVGYGLDHAEQYRNLPALCELLNPPR
jgi:hypoxanthine phosphoribosyltransferase